MKFPSKHIDFAKLTDLAENHAAAAERTALDQHFATCASCAGELGRLQQTLALMKADTSEDAPRDVLAFAMGIFDRPAATREPPLLRRVVAALTFDSNANLTPAFGVRASQSTTRQLLYSADERDIDLRVNAEADKWVVSGQLLGGGCVEGEIEIVGKSRSVTASLNELCEFSFPPLPSGNYSLRLLLNDTQLEIPSFELR